MKINKNNYEAWFIDYFDGALSAEQTAELMLFLNTNPKLKEEFDSFETISLADFDDEVKFPEKKNLKKNEPTIEELMVLYVDGTITETYKAKLLAALELNSKLKTDLERYQKTKLSPEKIIFENKESLKSIATDIEMLMSMNADGALSAAEKVILQKAISKNAGLKKEQDLYSKTKLQADSSIVFENKNSLKREKEVAVIPLFFRYAAAAAIALLVGIYIFMKTDVTPNAQYITFIKRELNYKRISIKTQENSLPESNNANQYAKKTNSNGYPYKIKQRPADTTVIDKNNVVEEKEKIVKVNTMDGSADSAYKKWCLCLILILKLMMKTQQQQLPITLHGKN
jgi:hypothetical protein